MFRGITTFYCTRCKHRFKAKDIEYQCTIYSFPQTCTNCGSFYTLPAKQMLNPFYRCIYKDIWKSMRKEHLQYLHDMGKMHFKPWVGKSYARGINGKRVMALGESHYCATPKEAVADLTSNVVNYYLSQEREHEGWMNTYTRFASALMSGKKLSRAECVEAWNKILFYNYVQVPISAPRVAPTSEQFATGEKPFFELLEQYKPHRILVWGKRLYNNLPQQGDELPGIELPNGKSIEVWGYSLPDGSVVKLLPITHPSAPTFSPSEWYPIIQYFING